MGMIFYYLGGEVNALFREGQVAHNGQAAIDRLKALVPDQDTSVAVYELPLDMAHLLRGNHAAAQAQGDGREHGRPRGGPGRLREAEHTGTLEMQTRSRRRDPAARSRTRVEHLLGDPGWVDLREGRGPAAAWTVPRGTGMQPCCSPTFSREVWKSRHEIQDTVRSRLQPGEGRRARRDRPAGRRGEGQPAAAARGPARRDSRR